MLHQIILQLTIGICISDFLTHGKKGSKCGGVLLIKSRKRTLAVRWYGSGSYTGCSRSLSIIMLCMMTRAFMVSHIWVFDHISAGNRITVNRAWSTPNARSTSFLQASWHLANQKKITSWHSAYDSLHKYCSSWIDAIRQVVSFVVLMVIDHKVHRRSMAFN
jgi:hypothetical protein